MNIKMQVVVRGLVLGFLLALMVSAVPTFLDWRTNPSGIFHGRAGTNLDVVLETFVSWLWPLFLVFSPVSIAVVAWISSRRSKHSNP